MQVEGDKIMCISLLTNLKSSNHLKKLTCKAPNMDEYQLRRSTDGTISFIVDMWVQMLLSNWFEINCNILINVITGCAIHILDSGLVVCYLVHLLVHINKKKKPRKIYLAFVIWEIWNTIAFLLTKCLSFCSHTLFSTLPRLSHLTAVWKPMSPCSVSHASKSDKLSMTQCSCPFFFSMGLLADQSPSTKWLTVFCNFVWSQKAAIECSSWNLVKKSLLILQLCKKIFRYPFPLCTSWVFSFFCVFSLVILTLNQKL